MHAIFVAERLIDVSKIREESQGDERRFEKQIRHSDFVTLSRIQKFKNVQQLNVTKKLHVPIIHHFIDFDLHQIFS